MNDDIGSYLMGEIDISPTFVAEMCRIKSKLESNICASFHLNIDMNYRAGQSLTTYFYAGDETTAKPNIAESNISVTLFVSSRGRAYTVMVRLLVESGLDTNIFKPSQSGMVWRRVSSYSSKNVLLANCSAAIDYVMEDLKYIKVDLEYALATQTSMYTLLDGFQANVFEVLFSEVD